MSDTPEPQPVAPPASLAGGYAPVPGVFDEMAAAPGVPRPCWEPFIASLERLGGEELSARADSARRMLREHGVTYNIYRDVQGLDRAWELDPIPLLIAPAEWQRLAAGLVQRARLLNRILADLYGPQRLLHEGLLPAALVFANPAFLRACHGFRPPRDLYLFLNAVDLARSPEGQWWVLADRTQAPSGAGYALENRIVMSRVLPDEFRDCRVQRLAGFFQAARDTLRSAAPTHRQHPNVVLLTPGPYNETYFEHVYLARYLGFPLVEGADLTVRDRRVFLKTLEGLQPVDVILRRVDDTFCDPLELRPDSFLGVPGLLEAARAGSITLANALGSGLVETPALQPFLPGLCRQLLGEELLLPPVATWWCGQPAELGYVLDHLQELVVKRAFSGAVSEPVFGGRLTAAQRERLVAQIRANPLEFVGQEQIALSCAPAWVDGRLAPRPLVLRTYVCAAEGGYAVMPGGLTRISNAPGDPVVSMQSGGGSKDTWMLSEGPVNPVTLLRPSSQVVRLERAAAEVPSRVADNLFWLGRYAERLEDTVRILRSLVARLVGEARYEQTPELAALTRLAARLDLLSERFRGEYPMAALEREILGLIYQAHRLGSVREVLDRLRHIAYVVRDRFSADTWRIFNKLQSDARARPDRLPLTQALTLLNTVLLDLAAFSGMAGENTTRGHGWRFLDIGRRLERAVNVVTLAEAGLAVGVEGGMILDPLLEIGDSVITYRRRYFAQPQWPGVLDLLLAEEANPRSLAFQLSALADHAANLPRDPGAPASPREAQLVEAMQARLRAMNFESLEVPARGPLPAAITELLAHSAAELRRLSDALTHRYFSHAVTRVS
jgi:uncharacterized circularly permuted ATP-grasp superfamily protein/uncharacterized alpha-E superfamily protein